MDNYFKDIFGKTNEIIASDIKVRGNQLKFNALTMQISNIAVLEASEGKFPLTLVQILILFAAIGLFYAGSFFSFLGFVILAVLAITFYFSYMDYKRNRYILRFHMNSSSNYYIGFKTIEAIQRIREELEMAINGKRDDQTIHIENQTVVHGNNHVVHNGNQEVDYGSQNKTSNHTNSVNTINWGAVEASLSPLLTDDRFSDFEKSVIGELHVAVKDHNEVEVRSIFSKFKTFFKSDVFKGVVSGVLTEFITFYMK
ncbi:hypothetical protein G7062_00130 [Erysipelothrix sp. HDW6C]|uniref:hypothetical protein n=1 Tax=Erysipelothrix sp. HDW6C TaxID=2714930 RepID=UPI00140C2FE2|nr:hypothetical protein [Erysipelothrix sp. HDW6C]QIK68782.1 hypothetical protein G7062_00130 [Erysipelothrix sp. HDW6C]